MTQYSRFFNFFSDEAYCHVFFFFMWLIPATTSYFLKGLATGSVISWYGCQISSFQLVVYKIVRYAVRWYNEFQWTCQTGAYPVSDPVDTRFSSTSCKASRS